MYECTADNYLIAFDRTHCDVCPDSTTFEATCSRYSTDFVCMKKGTYVMSLAIHKYDATTSNYTPECVDCPYGADCDGTNLKSC